MPPVPTAERAIFNLLCEHAADRGLAARAAADWTGFDQRLHALLAELGVEQAEDLLQFLTIGRTGQLPPPLAGRLRTILEDDPP